MKKFYKIEDDYAILELSKIMYPIIVIEKAMINFTDKLYIKLEESKENNIIKIYLKDDKNLNLENIIGEIYNELLVENLRYSVSKETKNIRELIIGRALYATCIDTSEAKIGEEDLEENVEENVNLNEILVNWFDKYSEENK